MKFVATFGLPLLLVASTVAAECAESEPSRVFSYSVGEKRVSVSKSGDRFVYHFGAAGKDKMSIVGVPATGNIFQKSQRFTGPEYQLRFTNGEFSYIVYSAEGNPESRRIIDVWSCRDARFKSRIEQAMFSVHCI